MRFFHMEVDSWSSTVIDMLHTWKWLDFLKLCNSFSSSADFTTKKIALIYQLWCCVLCINNRVLAHAEEKSKEILENITTAKFRRIKVRISETKAANEHNESEMVTTPFGNQTMQYRCVTKLIHSTESSEKYHRKSFLIILMCVSCMCVSVFVSPCHSMCVRSQFTKSPKKTKAKR